VSKFLLPIALVILLGLAVIPAVAQQTGTPTPTPIPRPAPTQTATDGRSGLLLYFGALPQGSTGVVQIDGEGLESARLRFLSRLVDFYPADGGLYALVPIGLDVTPRQYPLTVSLLYADGSRTTIDTTVEVTLGGFARQAFDVAPDRAYLTAPEIERNEYARLQSIFVNATRSRLWDGRGFQVPLSSEITSPFGSFRTLNQNTQTRHTGWDFRAAVGTPIQASARGEVAYAGPLDIRGNVVVVDHGFGVFSAYAHFSEIHVTAGQTVEHGQIIGMSGNTGRSNGPHLHWEINVNGEWVDSLAFTEMWLP